MFRVFSSKSVTRQVLSPGFLERWCASRPWWLVVVPILFLGAWFYLKVTLFRSLEYTADCIIHTQKAQSFLYGYPLLYDNFHGPRPYHNTFIELLLAPLVFFFGTYGLFIASTALLLFALLEILALANRASREKCILYSIVGFVFLAGPVGFWMFDNPIYGWHPETLSFPIAILLAIGLIKNKRSGGAERNFWFWLVLLLLTHENGAVVVCALLLMFELLSVEGIGSFNRALVKRLCVITFSCILIFMAGLLVQKLWDDAGSARLQSALSLSTFSQQAVVLDVLSMWRALFQLLFACAFALLVYRLQIYPFLVLILCVIPVLITGTVAGLVYNSRVSLDSHNIFWAPRFAFVWGTVLSGILLSIDRLRPKSLTWMQYFVLVLLVTGSVWFQDFSLRHIRSYDVSNRISSVLGHRLNSFRFLPKERKFLKCLARKVTRRVPVYSNGDLWAIFHMNNIDRFTPDNPYRQYPEIIACDTQSRVSFPYGCIEMQNEKEGIGYATTQVEGLSVHYQKSHEREVLGCLPIR